MNRWTDIQHMDSHRYTDQHCEIHKTMMNILALMDRQTFLHTNEEWTPDYHRQTSSSSCYSSSWVWSERSMCDWNHHLPEDTERSEWMFTPLSSLKAMWILSLPVSTVWMPHHRCKHKLCKILCLHSLRFIGKGRVFYTQIFPSRRPVILCYVKTCIFMPFYRNSQL